MRQADQWPFAVLALVIGVLGALSLIGADLAMQSCHPEWRTGGWAISGLSGLLALVYGAALIRKAMALRLPNRRADPAKLPDDVLDERRPVWLTLSDLFLDDQLDDAAQEGIARSLFKSGYGWTQLDAIMVTEVAPVLHVNLRMVAGHWGAFDPDWLEDHILSHMGREGYEKRARHQERYLMELIADDWAGVERHFHALGVGRRN